MSKKVIHNFSTKLCTKVNSVKFTNCSLSIGKIHIQYKY